MKTSHNHLLLAVALIAGGCQTAPSASTLAAQNNIAVTFKDQDKFTDARERFAGNTSQYYLDELSKHLKEAAAKHLKEGQKLNVTFTDIDLAGDFVPGRPGLDDVRIIKGIYIPHMALTFQLLDASGAVIKEGDRRLSDLNFQSNIGIIGRNDPLFHDKALLDRWVAQEF